MSDLYFLPGVLQILIACASTVSSRALDILPCPVHPGSPHGYLHYCTVESGPPTVTKMVQWTSQRVTLAAGWCHFRIWGVFVKLETAWQTQPILFPCIPFSTSTIVLLGSVVSLQCTCTSILGLKVVDHNNWTLLVKSLLSLSTNKIASLLHARTFLSNCSVDFCLPKNAILEIPASDILLSKIPMEKLEFHIFPCKNLRSWMGRPLPSVSLHVAVMYQESSHLSTAAGNWSNTVLDKGVRVHLVCTK